MAFIDEKTRSISCILGMTALCMIVANSGATTSDTSNAALLYYQALLQRPEPDDYRIIEDVLHDAEPSDRLRKYLKDSFVQETIMLAESGTRISNCDWGRRSSGVAALGTSAMQEVTHLAKLLCANARVLSHDGEHRAALESCLAMRRFAVHLGDDSSMLYGMAYRVDATALRCIQYILGSMPSETTTLKWLQHQLQALNGAPWQQPGAIIRCEQDARVAGAFRMLSGSDGDWKERFVEGIADAEARERAHSQTEDELLAQARRSYREFVASAISIIESDLPMDDKFEAVMEIEGRLKKLAAEGDPVILLQGSWDSWARWLRDIPSHALWYNSTLAAVEIYLAKARTGQLPAACPEDLPKAPYDGRDFEYERTETGFVLRYARKDHVRRTMREIEFKVSNE